MNINNELVALQMSGISKYKLASPLFIIAIFLSILSYVNYEYLSPYSIKSTEIFKSKHIKNSKHKDSVYTLLLDDFSKLIYQKYDHSKKELFDIFWIKSYDDIWHIKYLNAATIPPQGKYVDHFIRDKTNKLIKTESFPSYSFFQINFDKATNTFLEPYESRSISVLFSQYKAKRFSSFKDKAQILSQLNYKLAMPLLPFLIVIAIVPICMKFSRNNLFYIICSLSLFFFIGFYVLMDAVIILSENQVFSPFILIWSPFLLCFLFFGLKFFKPKIL